MKHFLIIIAMVILAGCMETEKDQQLTTEAEISTSINNFLKYADTTQIVTPYHELMIGGKPLRLIPEAVGFADTNQMRAQYGANYLGLKYQVRKHPTDVKDWYAFRRNDTHNKTIKAREKLATEKAAETKEADSSNFDSQK